MKSSKIKNSKKLNLNREALRMLTLTPAQLDEVRGAGGTNQTNSGAAEAYCSFAVGCTSVSCFAC
jgi:hypothetical protein